MRRRAIILMRWFWGRRDGFSSCRLLTVLTAIFTVYSPVYGQEVVAGRESFLSPSWRTTASENVGGTSALTTVHALPDKVELAFSAPVEFESASLRGSDNRPGRFYVDISPATLKPQRGATLNIDSGPIRRVRISLFRVGTIRVVLDLREKCEFALITLTDPYRLVILPQGANAMAHPSQPEPAREAKSLEPSISMQREEKKAEKLPIGRLDLVWQSMTQPWALMPHVAEPLKGAELTVKGGVESETFDLALPEDQSQFSSSLTALIDTALSTAADVTADWLWQATCQEERCPPVVGNLTAKEDAERKQKRMVGTTALLMEDSSKTTSGPTQSVQETFPIGGFVMDQIWLIGMTAGVLLFFLASVGIMMLWNLRKHKMQTEKGDGWEGRMAYLEEAVNRAGMLNNSFFHSLEVSQKRLETLLTQSDVAERNLRRLLHQAAFAGDRPAGRSTNSLETATLLLSEGEDVQQVARTLKLPLAQVRLLQELRSYTQEEKLTDALGKSAARAENDSLDSLTSHLNGAASNGMHIANGAHL